MVRSSRRRVGERATLRLPRSLLAQRGIDVTGSYSDPLLGSTMGVAVPVLANGKVEGAVQVELSKAETEARIQRNWLLLAGLGGVIALVVLLVSTLLARSFTKPLADLDRGAARLGEGDLAVRVDVPDDPPELTGLARSFNATAERLEALVRSQQAFVADASHQLRTPLAALRLRLENLEADGGESGSEDIERSLAEVQRLSQLVDSLLVLTRAEAARRMPEPVDLGAVIGRPHRRVGRARVRARRGDRRPASTRSGRRSAFAAFPGASSRCSTTCFPTRSKLRRPAPRCASPCTAGPPTLESKCATPARA